MIKSLEALCYLDDIAHGRKMSLDAHELKLIIEKDLKVLEIIYSCPFIIERLALNGKLGKEAFHRYLWGTISDDEVKKVKEFLNGKI